MLCSWCHWRVLVKCRDTEVSLAGWEECQVSFGQQWWSKALLASRMMFYQFCFWDFTHHQRHLMSWVNSGWFWKCALIQKMKWPPESSGTTDEKTNPSHPYSSSNYEAIGPFWCGVSLVLLYVTFLIAYTIHTHVRWSCVLQKPVTTVWDTNALVVTEAVLPGELWDYSLLPRWVVCLPACQPQEAVLSQPLLECLQERKTLNNWNKDLFLVF